MNDMITMLFWIYKSKYHYMYKVDFVDLIHHLWNVKRI